VADIAQLLGSLFSVLLVLVLGLMVFTTYVLARRPLILNLREIYFFHNDAFTRAWHLIIAGMTLFVVARAMTEGERLEVLTPPEGLPDLFLVLFAVLVLMAFWELIFVFQRYLPELGLSDDALQANMDRRIREALLRADREDDVQFQVAGADAIYVGRPSLGPHVHLSHYRGVVEGMTRYLERRFGQLGDALLYNVGRQTGSNAANHMKAEGLSPEDVVQQFLLELRTAGVALPQIVERSPQKVRIAFAECAICSGTSGLTAPRCHYLAGAVRGLYETVHGLQVEAAEVSCSCARARRRKPRARARIDAFGGNRWNRWILSLRLGHPPMSPMPSSRRA
jgi:predicted hydrocarbon binding protein